MTLQFNNTSIPKEFELMRVFVQNAGAQKSFEESECGEAFIVNGSSKGYLLDEPSQPERIYKSFIAATSTYLSKVKVTKEDEAAALVLTDTSGEFKFAAIVEYHENETENEPGNWSYIMTFNEEDLNSLSSKKKVVKHLYGDDAFKLIFDKVAYDVGGVSFNHERYMYDACVICVDTLIGVLDRESNDTEQVDIELEGYFVASVSVENGEKVFAITPDGAMKKIIKSDVALG
jgi:hypothetical protein